MPYVLGAAVLWAVYMPIADWVLGDLEAVGRSALRGVCMGIPWGAAMWLIERRLLARRAR